MNHFINTYNDLITDHSQTRQGFLEIALEKNKNAAPYVDKAKTLIHELHSATLPIDIKDLTLIRPAILSASGLSKKALKWLTTDDENDAIDQFVTNVLEPTGDNFKDEIVYRYLLFEGDALGGRMRNVVGHIAQKRLVQRIVSYIDTLNLDFKWFSNSTKKWLKTDLISVNTSDVKALWWNNGTNDYVLGLNLNIPIVKKNVDINLFKATPETYGTGNDIVNDTEKMVMFGELKGGVDPAGADEHWKTANTALNRIRESFKKIDIPIKTSFVGAAIESAMAQEIYTQLDENVIDAAANLYKDDQLSEYSKWIVGGTING